MKMPGPKISPFTMPRVSRAAVDRARRLGTHRGPLPLPGAKGFELILGGDEAAEPRADLVRIDGLVGQAAFEVLIPRQLVDELIHALSAAITTETLPPDLAGLLLEAAIAGLIGKLEETVGESVSLTGVHETTGIPRGFALTLRAPDRQWPVHLGCAADTLNRFIAPWPTMGRAMEWLPLRARIRVGLTSLSQRLLWSVRPGDVILAETCLGVASHAVLVVAEALFASVSIEADRILLAGVATRDRREWSMSGADEPEDGDAHLDDLPVRIAFDLGTVDLPLGDVRRLNTGMVLELGRQARELVEISANGRRIGRGELVEVDGMIGVRVVRIFARE